MQGVQSTRLNWIDQLHSPIEAHLEKILPTLGLLAQEVLISDRENLSESALCLTYPFTFSFVNLRWH